MSCLLEITMRKRRFDDFWCRREQKKTQIDVEPGKISQLQAQKILTILHFSLKKITNL